MNRKLSFSLLLGGAACAALTLTACAQGNVIFSSGGAGGSGGAQIGGNGGAGGSTGGSAGTTTTTSHGCATAQDCAAFSDACNVGACINGECGTLPANDGASCDDGKQCTQNDTCLQGVCKPGPLKNCSAGGPCSVGMCDVVTDTCITMPGNEGGFCNLGDPCVVLAGCLSGVCQPKQVKDCSYLDSICGIGYCDPQLGCQAMPTNDGTPCEDGLFCTGNDTCQGGACVGGPPVQCAPPGGCFVGACDPFTDSCSSMPGNDGAACDDGSPCTMSTTCSAGVCGGGTPVNNGAACDDGSSCTSGETCNNGACTGGNGPTIYFADDFKDSSKGWTLGPEWQIGPAMASPPAIGNPDPATDHSPSNDNGVAGVDIGENAQTILHPYYYMESPAFDTSAAQGPVILGFYRWLNSDYDPFMHNSIDVYNGSQWVNIWVTGSAPGVMDADWTFQSYDITQYKSASMRIRFGFDIGSNGVYTIGSWNIDDVMVGSAACP